MALTQLNQLQIAFKKLAGKAHTSPKLGVPNENISSFVQLGSSTLFANPIPTTGLPTNLYETSSGAIVEKIRFELVPLSDGGYTPSNGSVLSNTTINAEGETVTNGNHSFALRISGSYNTRSQNPRKGVAPFTDGYYLTGSAGTLQLVPPSFANGYAVTLYTAAGTEIPPLSTIDWILDYSTGVLYAQDAPGDVTPGLLDGYIYIGKYQSDPTLGYSGSFSGSFQGNGGGLTNLPASSIVGLNLSQVATGSVTASVGVGTTTFQIASGSTTLLSLDNSGNLTVSGSEFIGNNITAVGNAIVTGSLAVNGVTTLNSPLIVNATSSLNNTTITGSLLVTQNFTVLGTASFTRITGSEIVIGASTITLSTDDPVVRFGGILVVDSGSFGTNSTGSLLWDSEKDRWIYVTPSGSAEGYNSAILVAGPPNTGSIGDELGLTAGRIMKATGDDHIGSSLMRETGSVVSVDGNFEITGSLQTSGSLVITGSVEISSGITGSLSGSLQGGINATGTVSGSFSGSFQGNSTGTGTFSSLVATGSFSGSVTGTATLTSLAVNGTSSLTGPVNIVGNTLITGSTLQTTPLPTAVTSSETTGNYALLVSQSAWMYNHNAGVPRSNAWKSNLNGSYFNTFDHNTNASEILRFIAGLLSASAPAPTANTRFYDTVTSTEGSTSNTTNNPLGRVPRSSTNSTINYLNQRGWAATGSTIFEGETIYYDSNYNVSYTSNANGSTTITSSADAQLFGLGALDETVYLSSSLAFTFREANNVVDTAISSSQSVITLAGTAPQSSGNFQKNKINTANPAVIPAGFQDGKFVTSFANGIFVGGNNIAGRSAASISSSGDYIIAATIGVSSSVNSGYLNKTTSVTRFYSPLYAGSTIDTSFGQNSINHVPTFTALTATSRSLSGAPYLLGATWNYQDTASGVFSPLYYEGQFIFTLGSSDGNVSIGGTANQALNISNGQITGTSLIYDSTGVTQRSAGDIPSEGDIIKTSNTLTFTPGSTNIQQSSTLSPTSFTLTPTAYRRDNNSVSSGSAINYHTAGTFGQPAASGSLAYTNRAQGYDGSSLTGTSENFTGENSRVQITDAALSGSYTTAGKFITGSYVTDNLGELDLQVKPGYLVRPGGSYKYWLPTPTYTGGRTGAGTYRYYARAFRVTDNKASLRISTTGGTLGNWYTTSDYAVLVLFQSIWDLTGTPNVWDPTVNNSNALIAGGVARDDQYNPFNTAINIYGVGQVPSTPNSIAFNDTAKQFVNTTYPNYILLFRYKGDVAPLTNITITYTS
jgi:hypothetical protein